MAFNLAESVKELFTTDMVAKIADVLHEKDSNILGAVEGAVPVAITGLIHFGTGNPKNSSKLLETAKEVSESGLLENTGSLTTDNNLFAKGAIWFQDIFGQTAEKVEKDISSLSGIRTTSVTSLLSWIMSLALGTLGKKAAEDNLTKELFVGFLADQSKPVNKAFPAAIAGLAGLFKTEEETKKRVVPDASFESTEYAGQKARGRIAWLWPLLILGFVAFLYFMLKKDADPFAVQAKAQAAEPPAVEAPAVKGNVDAAGNFIYDVGAAKDFTLPDGSAISVGENSTEAKLLNFLTDANAQVSEDKTQGWIVLDRVYFVTGGSQLTPESQQQIKNIAFILKNFPNAEVKIGGYTDNTGSDSINVPLSGERANAAADEIVKNEVDASRVTSEGYGSLHPVCPANDTPECKAQNRRVDIRVTKK